MPQVTILEGGKPKNFAGVDKLQIALSGGGTSLWVPKDTRLLTALTANVNGTYPPPEGYFGFDTVIVDVAPSQVAGIDPETGQYVLVGTKKTEAEDPKWPTTPDDPYDPDNPDGHGWDPWKDGNPWDKDPYDDDWGDDDDEFTQEHIPSGIKIVTPPTKTTYNAGELIDYSGIRVQLIDENGGAFTNDRYPDGYIPFGELTFPADKAEKSGTYWADQYTDGNGLNAIRMNFIENHVTMSGGLERTLRTDLTRPVGVLKDGYGLDIPAEAVGSLAYLEIGSYTGVVYMTKYNGGLYVAMEATHYVQYGGGCYYMDALGYRYLWIGGGQTKSDGIFHGFGSGGIDLSGVPESTVNPRGKDGLNLSPAGLGVPVQWASPYDSITYEDKLWLNVNFPTDSEEGGFSGGGGEGTGGGGGGGGF